MKPVHIGEIFARLLPSVWIKDERTRMSAAAIRQRNSRRDLFKIQVKYNDAIVDPFIGLERQRECGIGKAPLWTTGALLSMLYQPTAVYNAGFSSTTPNPRIAREGLYVDEVLLEQSPVIAIWADIFWVQPGDKLKFLISGPNGETMMSHTATLKKMQARRFAFAGIRRKNEAWPKGPYTGEIRLIRQGEEDEYGVVRVITVN